MILIKKTPYSDVNRTKYFAIWFRNVYIPILIIHYIIIVLLDQGRINLQAKWSLPTAHNNFGPRNGWLFHSSDGRQLINYRPTYTTIISIHFNIIFVIYIIMSRKVLNPALIITMSFFTLMRFAYIIMIYYYRYNYTYRIRTVENIDVLRAVYSECFKPYNM